MLTIDLRRSTLPVCLVLLASCGSDGPSTPSAPAPVAPFLKTVAFASTRITISTVGQTAQLQVIGNYSDGTTQDMTGAMEFSSSQAVVATSSMAGLVTAWAPGTTTMTAIEKLSGELVPVATAQLTVGAGPAADPTLVPALLSPDDNASVPSAPTGILTLNWTPVPSAAAYHLSIENVQATFPALDKSDIANPPWQIATGGATSLSGWRWAVQAKVNGVFQAWSVVRTFNYVTASATTFKGMFVPPARSRQ